PQNTFPDALRWTPDSSGVIYRSSRSNMSNFWLQPIDGSEPKQLTNFTQDSPIYCEWSRDGKFLSCVRGVLMRDVVLFSALQ
ncbi:MAG TPA: hypothetical protein VNA17_10045, partial [Pyrinomonadaceae bacterium]|nr:hypothetical protein [Pyrinomonadaceae bacterium]